VRRWWFLVGGIVVACSGTNANRPAATPATKAVQPRASGHQTKTLTTHGGVLDSDGAQLTVPAGAVKGEATYSITLVSGADLEGWPQGTAFGFVFEPAGQQFRIPVLVELPSDGIKSEVMCQMASGERVTMPPDSVEEDHYHFHVTELPARCTIFAAEHAAALQSARARHGEVVAKQNARNKWVIQSELCNPNLFSRPNAEKGLEEPPGIGGCPPGMAPIPGSRVCVDRWEAHVVEVLDDGTFHSWSPYFNPGAIRIRARSAPGAVPQSYISQIQATAACAEAGKRMCTDTEWLAACHGSKKTVWPYGNAEKNGACNDRRDRHPAIEYLESTDVFAKLEHPCINQIPDTVFLTGTKAECSTPEGVFDMVGNLHEWTADKAGTFRGGYYVEAKLNGRGCDYVTTRHDAIYWDYSIGFRCCADQSSGRDSSGVRVSPE
jgi:hypothetical protein